MDNIPYISKSGVAAPIFLPSLANDTGIWYTTGVPTEPFSGFVGEEGQGSKRNFPRVLEIERADFAPTGRCHNGRRFGHPPKGGEAMRITLHIGAYTVTIIVKRRNRHPAR